MACYMTLVFLCCAFSLTRCSRFPVRKYYYVNMATTWTDAQQYCREKYTDLATIESMDDINRLKSTFSYSWAWIGLKDDPESWKTAMGNDSNSWRWSATGETSKTGFSNWATGQPNSGSGKENCVFMDPNGKWIDANCESLQAFVCYHVTDQSEKTYEFISIPKTWAEARNYCREHFTDLPVIESTAENSEVYSATSTHVYLWIGLYRVPWAWSDNSQSSFRFWQSGSPNNYAGQQLCMTENPLHQWNDGDCDEKHPFICHQVSKLRTVVKIKILADKTDPATNTQILQQLGAVLTSRGWTDFSLQWKIQPRKQREELPEPDGSQQL